MALWGQSCRKELGTIRTQQHQRSELVEKKATHPAEKPLTETCAAMNLAVLPTHWTTAPKNQADFHRFAFLEVFEPA